MPDLARTPQIASLFGSRRRRPAAICTTSTAGVDDERPSRRGGRPSRHRAPPARPLSARGSRREAAGRRLRPRPAARRGAQARIRGDRAGAVGHSAEYARESGPRRERARAGGLPGHRRFAAIVLADVLEHLDDPVGAIDRCESCSRPAGCSAWSPRPLVAHRAVAGGRWWGYLPAHTYLLPRTRCASRCARAG